MPIDAKAAVALLLDVSRLLDGEDLSETEVLRLLDLLSLLLSYLDDCSNAALSRLRAKDDSWLNS